MTKEIQSIGDIQEKQLVKQFHQGFIVPGLIWPRTPEILPSKQDVFFFPEEFAVDVGDVLITNLKDNQKMKTTRLVSCVGVAVSLQSPQGPLHALAHIAYSIDESLENIFSELEKNYQIDDIALSLPHSTFHKLSASESKIKRLLLENQRLLTENKIDLRGEKEVGGMEVTTHGVVFTRRIAKTSYSPIQKAQWLS